MGGPSLFGMSMFFIAGPERSLRLNRLMNCFDGYSWLTGPRVLRAALVELGCYGGGERIGYLNVGLAVGQSRFLVEDPLRDDRDARRRFCHVRKDPLASLMSR